MKRLKYRIMELSIRKKLVFYSYLVLVPILLLISILLFCYNYDVAVQEEEDTCLSSVQGLSDSIEAMQKSIIEMGTYICINNDITVLLTSNRPHQLNKDTQLWVNQAPMQMIQDMVAINGQIKTVAIYPENSVLPYLRCIDFSAHYTNIRDIREQEMYQQAVKTKSDFLWKRVPKGDKTAYEYNRTDKIVMYREIYDLAKRNKRGYLMIGASADRFDEVCRNALRDDKEMIFVVSKNGEILSSCGAENMELAGKIIAEAENAGDKAQSKVGAMEEYKVYQYRNADTGTVVYKVAPRPGLANFADTVIYTPVALLVGVLLGLYPIMVLVSNIVSKPLKSLCIAMEKFKKGDFNQKVEVVTLDEVGEASACFNSMVDDIKELINRNYVMELKERESELDALQAQINPHFLYNTLDSLYWKALEAGDEELGEDIIALSQLFRLALSRGKGIVTVRNEAELLERYLHIQKMRFGKRLNYKIWMEESIQEELIPKLILQPFVENAIVHGFETGNADFYLSITGNREAADMVFYIRDTGVGMSREQIQAIWEEPDTKQYASQRIGRYAIKNIKERLELVYGGNFELSIESKEGHGTAVKIRIPCRQTEEA